MRLTSIAHPPATRPGRRNMKEMSCRPFLQSKTFWRFTPTLLNYNCGADPLTKLNTHEMYTQLSLADAWITPGTGGKEAGAIEQKPLASPSASADHEWTE